MKLEKNIVKNTIPGIVAIATRSEELFKVIYSAMQIAESMFSSTLRYDNYAVLNTINISIPCS